jgi:hypothetical protein
VRVWRGQSTGRIPTYGQVIKYCTNMCFWQRIVSLSACRKFRDVILFEAEMSELILEIFDGKNIYDLLPPVFGKMPRRPE